MTVKLTKEESAAIKELQSLAKTWPETLWVFAGGSNGPLAILKLNADGERAMNHSGSVDHDFIVGEASIPNDGGGW